MDEPTNTPVPFPAKLRATYRLSKLATSKEKKLVLETTKEVLEEKASESWESISFEVLAKYVAERLQGSVRTTSFRDAFAYATAILIAEGVPKDNHVSRGDYFYWSKSE